MQITHYCNSFNSFKVGNSTLVCDPWVGEAAQTAWVSFPVHENGGKLLNNIKPDFIYSFEWEPNCLAIWSNYAVLHSPVNDFIGEDRIMHRITIE